MGGLENLITTMEEMGMDQEQIHELLTQLGNIGTLESLQVADSKESFVASLRERMDSESDWRKKASIAAQIVKMGFEE